MAFLGENTQLLDPSQGWEAPMFSGPAGFWEVVDVVPPELEDYNALQKKALALIEKYGKTVTFVTSGHGVYDPTTRSIVEPETVTVTRKVSPPRPYESRLIDGDLVQDGDAVMVLPHAAPEDDDGVRKIVTPEPGMRVDVGTDEQWKIVSVNTVRKAGKTIVYEIQLRQ